MDCLKLRTFEPDELLLIKLCLEMKLLTEEQLAHTIQQHLGKNFVYALGESGYLTKDQVADLLRLHQTTILCPHCQTVNYPGERKNYVICKECRQVLQDERHLATTSRRQQYGKYKILEKIGEGSVGILYKACNIELDRISALKALKEDQITAHLLQRFKQEAKAAASLNHPNIVSIYDIGEDYGRHYIAMEFVKGRPLSELIRDKELSILQAAEIAKAVASGLEHAHSLGVIHRDIKPENIMIPDNGPPKITDFGLAKQLIKEANITQEGTIMGTPLYMSPEQAQGSREVGPLSDLYSLGVVLYEMLVGRPPFTHHETVTLLRKIVEEAPNSPRRLDGRIPATLDKICLKAMAKNPQERFSSAKDMCIALAEFLKEKHSDDIHAPRKQSERIRRVSVGGATAVPVAQRKSMKELMMGQNDEKADEYKIVDLCLDMTMWAILLGGLVYLLYRIMA